MCVLKTVLKATGHQSYRAKVMLQSIVYIFHDCANQIIMVVLQSSLHTVIELVKQRAALLIPLELHSIRATGHQSYRAKVMLQSIMNMSHDCAQ